MADSAIFKYANDISMNRSASSARSVTTGGYARTHRLGPSLISLDVNLPILTEEQYHEVENELFSIDDGIFFLDVNVSNNNGNNIMSKTAVELGAGQTEIKVMNNDYSTLRQITLTNLKPNTQDIFKVGDFIQFYNSPKVYQISKPLGSTTSTFTTTSAGTCKIRLSTPLVSNIGLNSGSQSIGSQQTYQIVNGVGDESEQVSYDWVGGSGTNSQGLITFTDTAGNPYQYADGTYAVCHILSGYYTANDIRNTIINSIAGNAPGGLTQAEQDANNKLGEILNTVTGFGNPDGTLTFDFNVANVRLVLTTTSKPGQSVSNETVLSTITNPYQNGLITIRNADNSIAKDTNGNDITIPLPRTLNTAQDIYNHVYNLFNSSTSTSVLKTEPVFTFFGSGNFNEYWNETNLDHVGTFSARWSADFEGCTIELTTPTGPNPTDYNAYEFLNDTVSALITDGIEIENATHTYTAGEYIQPQWVYPGTSYTKKILSVSTVGTTTTINFDTTFSSGTTGWYNYSPNNAIARHQNDSLSQSTGFISSARVTSAAQFYTSNYPALMGPDVNMRLMLTKKPAVTIIPKDEEKNLYQYGKFEFTEVL